MTEYARILLGASILTVLSTSSPALEVIGQDSGARPVEAVLGNLLERFEAQEPVPVPTTRAEPSLLEGGLFPIRSTLPISELFAGSYEAGVPLERPLCVIGDDPVSLRWLTKTRRDLVRVGAVCLLVRADSREQVERIRERARPVPVQLLPFDVLARQAGVMSVPRLLLPSGRKP